MYERVQPYIRAGVPEEFYGFLLWEQEEQLDVEDAVSDGIGMPTDEEFLEGKERYQRYLEWRRQRDEERGGN